VMSGTHPSFGWDEHLTMIPSSLPPHCAERALQRTAVASRSLWTFEPRTQRARISTLTTSRWVLWMAREKSGGLQTHGQIACSVARSFSDAFSSLRKTVMRWRASSGQQIGSAAMATPLRC
jgi:hypothetical protein